MGFWGEGSAERPKDEGVGEQPEEVVGFRKARRAPVLEARDCIEAAARALDHCCKPKCILARRTAAAAEAVTLG